MAAKISISVPQPELLEWAQKRAARDGVSLSAVFMDAVRRARQAESRTRLLEWLGDAATLTPEREEEIRAQLAEDAPLPRKSSKRSKSSLRTAKAKKRHR